jgi:hypothetical protein
MNNPLKIELQTIGIDCLTECGKKLGRAGNCFVFCLNKNKFPANTPLNQNAESTDLAGRTDSSYTTQPMSKISDFLVSSAKVLSIVGGGIVAARYFLKALSERKLTWFIGDIAVANLAAILSVYPLTNSWKIASLAAFSITTVATLVRSRKSPAPTDPTRRYHKTYFFKHKNIQPSGSLSLSLDTLSSQPAEPKKLSQAQEQELNEIIAREARIDRSLDPSIVKHSLDALRQKMVPDPEDHTNFENFKIKVIELVSQRCTMCHNGNTFTGTSFEKTLIKCRCTVSVCIEGSCRETHWKGHPH